jgi:hypothetical protein
MRKIVFASALASAAVFACGDAELRPASRSAAAVAVPAYAPNQIPSTGPVPAGCVRTEGGVLGKNATVSFGGVSITFTAWKSKDGKSKGEYVQFSFTATGPVAYAVKAGRETYYGTDTFWTHPNGLSGPEASAISNITFCPGLPPDAGTPDAGTPDGGPDPGGERGDTCTSSSDCYAGACDAGSCAGGGEGERCRTAADCQEEHNCVPEGADPGGPTVCEPFIG